jgi:hypothetical protein
MIKSTVSGGALVTSSPSDAKSTRQRGVKHSITKRFTRGARWEVRLTSLGPRKAPPASCRIVEPQVAEVLARDAPNRSAAVRSWPKTTPLAPPLGTERRVVRRGRGIRVSAGNPLGIPTARDPSATSARRGATTALTSEGPLPERLRGMRPRDAPVRPSVLRVGGMALRSGPGSGILLGTPGTGDRVEARRACAGGLRGRTLGRVGREVANWPKPVAAAARPARTVLSAARRVSAALAENPHHGRS